MRHCTACGQVEDDYHSPFCREIRLVRRLVARPVAALKFLAVGAFGVALAAAPFLMTGGQ